jgi:hypothetical protein
MDGSILAACTAFRDGRAGTIAVWRSDGLATSARDWPQTASDPDPR